MYKVVPVYGKHDDYYTAVDEKILNEMCNKGYVLKQVVIDPRVPNVDIARAILGIFEYVGA